MSSPVNLEEYRAIKEIVTNYPNSIKTLDKCLELLYNSNDEHIKTTIDQIELKKMAMQFTLGMCEEHLKGIKLNE